MVGYIELTEIVYLRHGQTFGGAYGGTKSAKAAFGHVDIELGSIDALGSTVGSLADGFYRLNRLYFDTVYWTNLGAFIADDTVFYFIVQAVTCVIGHWQAFARVLQGYYSCLLFEVIFVLYSHWLTTFARLQEVAPRKL